MKTFIKKIVCGVTLSLVLSICIPQFTLAEESIITRGAINGVTALPGDAVNWVVSGITPRGGINYVPLQPLPDQPAGNSDIKTYLIFAFKAGISVAGILSVLMLVYSGFEYATTDSVWGTEEAKKKMTNVVTGLILILVSYILLNTVNKDTVSLKLDFGADTVKIGSGFRDGLASERAQAALNQKLRADIALYSARQEEVKRVDSQIVALATEAQEIYDSAGQNGLPAEDRAKYDVAGQDSLSAEDRVKYDAAGRAELSSEAKENYDAAGRAQLSEGVQEIYDAAGRAGLSPAAQKLYDSGGLNKLSAEDREKYYTAGRDQLSAEDRKMYDAAGRSELSAKDREIYAAAGQDGLSAKAQEIYAAAGRAQLSPEAKERSASAGRNGLPAEAKENYDAAGRAQLSEGVQEIYDAAGRAGLSPAAQKLYDSGGLNKLSAEDREKYYTAGRDQLSAEDRKMYDAAGRGGLSAEDRKMYDAAGRGGLSAEDRSKYIGLEGDIDAVSQHKDVLNQQIEQGRITAIYQGASSKATIEINRPNIDQAGFLLAEKNQADARQNMMKIYTALNAGDLASKESAKALMDQWNLKQAEYASKRNLVMLAHPNFIPPPEHSSHNSSGGSF